MSSYGSAIIATGEQFKSISLADELVKQLKHWYSHAKRALAKNFMNYDQVYNEDLIHDLYLSLLAKKQHGINSGFASSVEEANCQIASAISGYAKNTKYVAKLEDCAVAKKGTVFVSLESTDLDDTVAGVTYDYESSEMNASVYFSKKFVKEWDSMADEGEMTIEAKLEVVHQLAPVYAEATESEKPAILKMIKETLELDENTPEEIKVAMLDLLRK